MTSHAEQLARTAGREAQDDPVQHETASAFVVKCVDGEWHVLLIWHVRLGALTVPGGHVEKREREARARLPRRRSSARPGRKRA